MTGALIIQALRTPRGAGKTGGSLSGISAPQLLGGHLQELRERSGVVAAMGVHFWTDMVWHVVYGVL